MGYMFHLEFANLVIGLLVGMLNEPVESDVNLHVVLG
jgi:hypothetical protein